MSTLKEKIKAAIEKNAEKYSMVTPMSYVGGDFETGVAGEPFSDPDAEEDYTAGANSLADLLIKYHEALSFYAANENWFEGDKDECRSICRSDLVEISPNNWGGGKRAREALSEIEKALGKSGE